MDIAENGSESRIDEIVVWVLLIVLLVFVLRTLNFLFLPFALALLFHQALGAPLSFLRRLQLPSVLRLSFAATVTFFLFATACSLIRAGGREFAAVYPAMEEKGHFYVEAVLSHLGLTMEQGRGMLAPLAVKFGLGELPSPAMLPGWLDEQLLSLYGGMIWVIVFMIFMIVEGENLADRVRAGFGEKRGSRGMLTLKRMGEHLQRYLGVKLVSGLLGGVLVGATLMVLEIPFAEIWGLLFFLMHFTPVVGPVLAVIPAIAITFLNNGSPGKSAEVAAVIIIVYLGMDYFLEPRLLGRHGNPSPLTILFSFVLWGWMWGPAGMLMAVPLTAAIQVLLAAFNCTSPMAALMGDIPHESIGELEVERLREMIHVEKRPS